MNTPVIHENLPLIEVTDRMILDQLFADPRVARFLLTRLSDTLAVVAPNQMDVLVSHLIKLGHMPKILD